METALALARLVHFAALMSQFGAAFFVAALAPASLRLAPGLRRAALPLAALALLSALAWFGLVAQAMTGETPGWGDLADVAVGTAFGRVWLFHVAILLALTGAARAAPRVLAVLAAAGVASLALTGHAAMQDGAAGTLHRGNHALHLLAAAGWLGGLPPFLICLRLYPARRDALAGLMAYSRAGHFAVPLVLLTGALDAAMTTGLPPWRAMTLYRQGLTLKVAIFALMTALALVNRYALAPRAGSSPSAARALAAGAVGEWALAMAAIADASFFALQDPA